MSGKKIVFVYGSLMSFKVLEVLLHRIPKIQPAYLTGFTRLAQTDKSYPAIVETISLSLNNFPESIHNDELRDFFNRIKSDQELAKNGFVQVSKHNDVNYVNKVKGLVLKGLTAREIDILDFYEDEEYVKKTVPIVVNYNLNWCVEVADVYVKNSQENLYNFWSFDAFCGNIESFLPTCVNYRMEYDNKQINKK